MLVDGDYKILVTKMVAQLKLDVGAGGLWEDIGNWPATHGGLTRRSVNTIEDEVLGDASVYESSQLPAIIVQIASKVPEDQNKHLNKIFNVNLTALTRSDDAEGADTEMYKVLNRLEAFAREQNDVLNLWGLAQDGTDIEGMDVGAGVVTTLIGTEIIRLGDGEGEKQLGRHTMGTVSVEIDIPCQFAYS